MQMSFQLFATIAKMPAGLYAFSGLLCQLNQDFYLV